MLGWELVSPSYVPVSDNTTLALKALLSFICMYSWDQTHVFKHAQ